MSAKTPWFYCGHCGFKNHPRGGQDPNKCEQCGHDISANPSSVSELERTFLAADQDYIPS